MELSDWVISTLERKQPIPRIKSSSKRARNCILQKLDYDPMGKHTKRIEKLGVLFIDTIKAGIIYLSMVKDLVLYSLLVYTSKYILLHRFETVDGYDMDKVAIYLIFVVTSSKLALVILQLANWNVLHGYCYNRPPGSHLLIKICAVIFPFHFPLLERSRLKQLTREQDSDLRTVFNDIKKKEEATKTRKQFISILHKMKGVKDNSLLVNKMYVQAQLTTTILERMPLCAILASLFITCRGKSGIVGHFFPKCKYCINICITFNTLITLLKNLIIFL